MTPERWQHVSDLYEAVLDRPAEEREAFLDQACAGDSALRREVGSLLAQDDHPSPLDQPVWVPEALLAESAGAGDAADYNAGSPQLMRLAAGTRLGPYEIQSAIGAGGMGEVYRGRDTRLDRPVAIKVLAPGMAADAGFRARFEREAKTISQLDHPNICPLFDVGDVGGVAFLVMPLLEGESLLDRLRRGPVPVPDALRIATSLASALAYAHGRGVLHRDIKPQNVLLLADGRVQLLDFGVAKSQALETADAEADTTPALTRFGQTLGTPEYMSPEQLAARVVDGRSDMFSLGIVIFLMATGTHPFRGATAAVTSGAILNRPAPALAPELAELDRVVQRMLQKHPADRYPAMADCLADLRALERGAVTPGPVAATASAARSSSRPSARRATVAGFVGVTALAAVAVFTLLRDRAETPAAPSTASSAAAPAQAVSVDAAPVVFWLDVRQGEAPSAATVRSLGDETYRNGWRFRVNVQLAAASHVYLLSEDQPSADNPTGLELLFAGETPHSITATLTSPWFVFAGAKGSDRLWLLSARGGLRDLADLAAALQAGSRGIVSDARTATLIKTVLLASVQGARLSRDRSAQRATLTGTGPSVATRLELQHD